MKRRLHILSRFFILICIPLLFSTKSSATHIFGGDLYYTYVSGNTYTVTLVIYGDCSGASFPTLPTSTPQLLVYKDTTNLDTTITMKVSGSSLGVEVTPVCPKYLDSTACHGGDIPGIKKFVWTANVVLNGTSHAWVFQFAGNLVASSAGRSNSITNIGPGTTMYLQDTLDNTAGPNSSAQFTTIPTPFFCDNQLANYNPGAVAPAGDSISMMLVPGLNGPAPVTYNTGFSADNPLAVSDTLKLNSTTGQLTFTPNALQKALLVEQVNEYKDGKFVGTSMREMTIVILNCDNPPATGPVLPVSGTGEVKVDSNNSLSICKAAGVVQLNATPTSPDGVDLSITATGLPAGATFTVVGDKTPNPVGTLKWDVSDPSVLPGKYTFYLTYIGDECPLTSNTTQAYTLTVLPYPTIGVQQRSLGSCSTYGDFIVISPKPWTAKIYRDTSLMKADTSLNSDTLLDSLPVGSYKITLFNEGGCSVDTTFNIASFPSVSVLATSSTPATCNGYRTGIITLKGTGGDGLLTYSIDSLAPLDSSGFAAMNRPNNTTGVFDSLYSGVYKLTVTDINTCKTDTIIKVSQPDTLALITTATPNKCIGIDTVGTARVIVTGGTPPYKYLWNTAKAETTNIITSQPNGFYVVYVTDSHSCFDSSATYIDYDDCCAPYVPTAFTPNGDGKNDVFRIRFKGDIKLEDFSIYNRYGEKIFYTIYPNHGWDGTFNGVPQDIGTYFYHIKFVCGQKGDHETELQGDFTLIR